MIAMKTRAFTITELLVVVLIIGALASLLLPSLVAARRQARLSVDVQHMRQIALASLLYADTAEGVLPITEQLLSANRSLEPMLVLSSDAIDGGQASYQWKSRSVKWKSSIHLVADELDAHFFYLPKVHPFQIGERSSDLAIAGYIFGQKPKFNPDANYYQLEGKIVRIRRDLAIENRPTTDVAVTRGRCVTYFREALFADLTKYDYRDLLEFYDAPRGLPDCDQFLDVD
jgi:prepilin-type N-terminal cleavage/methylation domain-containing protein